MKCFISLLMCFSLSGCYQVTSAGDVNEALSVCSTHGGINKILVSSLGTEFVTCQDEYGRWLHREGNQ